MSSHEKLSAAANDRKTRLAQLKSLKRKQAPTADEPDHESSSLPTENATALTRTNEPDNESDNAVTRTYLSGRNFDPETRNVKLGFENQPIADPTSTLEYKAQQLALETKQQQEEETADDKGLDLFKLQPKKPNWDLKRDLEQKTKPLEVQTENAIARLVRERIEGQKAMKEKEARQVGGAREANEGDGEEVGMEGSELVEAMHLKEQEEERERKRDEDEDVS
ncbi:cwf18 pre-mRNA splicing factor-domain-containing protein [Phaeosphaeriaceae sp. PMI808]|nr:cwf18 pre-mRNA splicing factor-domain-containing protein [Phaeosphaeriaceae sp. PMI808]